MLNSFLGWCEVSSSQVDPPGWRKEDLMFLRHEMNDRRSKLRWHRMSAISAIMCINYYSDINFYFACTGIHIYLSGHALIRHDVEPILLQWPSIGCNHELACEDHGIAQFIYLMWTSRFGWSRLQLIVYLWNIAVNFSMVLMCIFVTVPHWVDTLVVFSARVH